MSLAPDDFPDERLDQRLHFLLGRAEAHVRGLSKIATADNDILAQACAATLYRDAACVALLLERVRQARTLLHKSGKLFLNLGLPVGASLIALAGHENAQDELDAHEDVLDGARQQWASYDFRERDGLRRPLSDRARSEPRQLLALMQADWLWDERRGSRIYFDRDEPLRVALKRNGGHPAGATGLSIDSYALAAQRLSEHQSFYSQVPDSVAITMSTMLTIRVEHLHAARKDSFHWRMLARPAELIDLDATILMYLATDDKGASKAGLEDLMVRHDATALVNAPARVAAALRQDQNLERRTSI